VTPALACLLALAAAAPVTRHGGGKDDPALRGTLAVLAEAIHRLGRITGTS